MRLKINSLWEITTKITSKKVAKSYKKHYTYVSLLISLTKMRKINKILLIWSLVGLFAFNFSLAQSSLTQSYDSTSDCGKFAAMSYTQKWTNWFNVITQSRNTDSNKYSNFLSIDQQNAIIDNDSLNTAMLNLKKYCCEHEQWWLNQKSKTCIDDSVFFNDSALESPYLFDHLFDVIMRRLSGLTGEKNLYEKTNITYRCE